MIYPLPIALLENGCIAIARSRSRKEGQKGSPKTDGRYGVRFEGDIWKSNRLSYKLNISGIPRTPENLQDGLVLHTCDNAWCINPDHLYLGSFQQNMKDFYARHPTIRSKRSEQFKGKPKSIEHRKKISDSKRKRDQERQISNSKSEGSIS